MKSRINGKIVEYLKEKNLEEGLGAWCFNPISKNFSKKVLVRFTFFVDEEYGLIDIILSW